MQIRLRLISVLILLGVGLGTGTGQNSGVVWPPALWSYFLASDDRRRGVGRAQSRAARTLYFEPRPPYGTPEQALVASSAIHTLRYAAYVWLAAKAGAVFATQTSYVVTLSGELWAILLLDEQFSAWVWAAMAVMQVGLFLVRPHQRKNTGL